MDLPFNSLGIKKLLSNLNPNKAIGPDNIPGHFLNLFVKYNFLDNAKYGFRRNRCAISQLIITINDFASTLRDQKQTDAILLDFSKAFDKVDHEGLF